MFNEYENLPVEEYAKVVSTKVGVLLRLINTLHEDKIQMASWKIWSEPLLFKMCYHISSLLQLCEGTILPYETNGTPVMIFDEPTISVLFRTILENYLTFYYLFADDIEDAEKEFRSLVYRYCGSMQRTQFDINSLEAREKQKKEAEFVETLWKEIKESNFYQKLNERVRIDVKKGIKPRLFKSWKSLITESGLRKDVYRNLYGYKSNYSHSEFISVLQIYQGKYGFKPKSIKGHYVLFLVHSLIGKTILELNAFFPSIAEHFMQLNEDLKLEIFALNKHARESAIVDQENKPADVEAKK